jgi:diadenosine tetraphosphate (Ap4A) HIT family hydrolase
LPIALPEVDPCPFCDLIAGRRNDWLVIEDGQLHVIMLAAIQFEVGQCLVIPKRHVALLTDLTWPETTAIVDAAQRLARAMVQALDPDGITLYQNNGAYAGQDVAHFHQHVVPRQPGSNWGLGPPHLAHFATEERRAKEQAPVAITDEKRATVERLWRQLAPREVD